MSPMAAVVRPDAQELASKLIVSDLGNEDLVMNDHACQPATDAAVLAGMADLAQDGGIEQEPQESDVSAAGAEENLIRSIWPMSHPGSSETSSAAHRSSIATTRAACSARTASIGDPAGLAVTAGQSLQPSGRAFKVSELDPFVGCGIATAP